MDLDALLDRQRSLIIQFEDELELATQKIKSLLDLTSVLKHLQAERLEQQNSSSGKAENITELSDTCLIDELVQLKSHILRGTDATKEVDDKLAGFCNRLGEVEKFIELCCEAQNLETRFFEKEKDLAELESKANDVVDVYGNHLGTYTIVYNVVSLMLLKHIECTWSPWVRVVLVLAFAFLLVLQVGISYSKIHMIGRMRGSLIKQLTDFRKEAIRLGEEMGIQSFSEDTGCPATDNFHGRMSLLVSKTFPQESIPRFSRVFLRQLIIPAMCLFIMFVGMMSSVYPDCDKVPPPAPAHGLGYISDM